MRLGGATAEVTGTSASAYLAVYILTHVCIQSIRFTRPVYPRSNFTLKGSAIRLQTKSCLQVDFPLVRCQIIESEDLVETKHFPISKHLTNDLTSSLLVFHHDCVRSVAQRLRHTGGGIVLIGEVQVCVCVCLVCGCVCLVCVCVCLVCGCVCLVCGCVCLVCGCVCLVCGGRCSACKV